jgi:GH18 family chitinase
MSWSGWRRGSWGGVPPTSTYYLDPIGGRDTNSGASPAEAWGTYAKAESVVLSDGQSITKKIGGEFIPFKTAAANRTGQGLVIGYYQTVNPAAITLADIDWEALTHISHDHVEPNNDGSLNTDHMSMTPAYIAPLIAAAHAHGVKVLLNIADIAYEQTYPLPPATGDPFVLATGPGTLGTFVNNLVQFVLENGYDGIDIDWEFGQTALAVRTFMAALYPAIKAQNPTLHVNMAVGAGNALCWKGVKDFTDTFTVMCYDFFLSAGCVTWLNAPLFGGAQYTFYGLLEPSIETIVPLFKQLGVPASKILLGVPFYGYVFSRDPSALYDGTAVPLLPRQPYAANFLPQSYTPYNAIPPFYTPQLDSWDDLGQCPFIGIPGADVSLNQYVTYDDPAATTAKVAWAQGEGLAGVAFWELSLDYFPTRPIVSPLLNAIRVAYPKIALTSATPGIPSAPTAASVSAISATLNWAVVSTGTSYHVKRSTTSGSGYATLATTIAATYTDATLSSGVTYYYVISALNNAVEGANSAERAVTATAGSAPAAPTGLAVTAAGPTVLYQQNFATLNWTASAGAASYNVLRSAGVSGQNYALLANTADVTFTDLTLTGAATYYYVVTAVSSSGLESVPCGEVATTTPLEYVPPNILASPAAINVSPWTVSGTGASASSATTLVCATTSDTFLTQWLAFTVATNYLLSVTVTAGDPGCFLALTVYDAAFDWPPLATLGQWYESGIPTTVEIPFASGANVAGSVSFDFTTNGNAVAGLSITGASISVVLPEMPINLVVSPHDVTTMAWAYSPGAANSATSVICNVVPDIGKNVLGLSQVSIPVTPHSYYIATVSLLRTDIFTGDGGYVALSMISEGFGLGLGLSVAPLIPGIVVDMYVMFNSGVNTTVIFALFLTGGAASSIVTLSNIAVVANPYGALT